MIFQRTTLLLHLIWLPVLSAAHQQWIPYSPIIRDFASILDDLEMRLSSNATVYLPGSEGFQSATGRWSTELNPSFDLVVAVAVEGDVEVAV